ncbi:hypothetical protein K490DRAFT_45761 [Saccharata proteae CBS 121410]|uniref:Nuclear protein Es2 n=1 Tax=Saccharata proteae CBS 121410 TaxID=1314787 RepID=A0A9P4LX69_9PEZI|nr:hypothetical protein K490DRAFT_45761 [Saccharata proteae CBS 121410]
MSVAGNSNNNALVKRPSNDNNALMMPPPPPPKRIKRPARVLDEDTYTSALDHIIARDYFPGLREVEAQLEYLNALDSRNGAWISEAGRNLEGVMTPGPNTRRRRGTSLAPQTGPGDQTPRWDGDTPRSVVGSEVGMTPKRVKRSKEEEQIEHDRENLSLSQFQAKYTSEDNVSVYELLDKENAKRRETVAWAWNDNRYSAAREKLQQRRSQLLLENSGKIGNRERALVLSGKGRKDDDINPDTRPAMPDFKKSEPRNALMFGPDSIEDSLQTIAQAAEAKSHAAPKAVVYSNTRFQPTPDEPTHRPSSPSLSAVNDAIAGRPRPSASSIHHNDGATSPRINGYGFVASPSPSPSPEPEEPRHLLSRLGVRADTSGPSHFKISHHSRREELHHKMVDKTAREKRAHAAQTRPMALDERLGLGLKGKTQTPRFTSGPNLKGGRGVGAAAGGMTPMTPAAQRLFDKVATPRGEGKGFGDAFGRGEGQKTPRWTPRLRRRE